MSNVLDGLSYERAVACMELFRDPARNLGLSKAALAEVEAEFVERFGNSLKDAIDIAAQKMFYKS